MADKVHQIWLASYPRSGNTMLRSILWNCFGLPSTSIYPRDLGGNQELERLVGHFEPDSVHPQAPSGAPLLIKTHQLPKDAAPAIYVLRNGRPAILSLWKFYRMRESGQLHHLHQIISGEGYSWSAWAGHVAAWQPWARPNTLLIRYEEMVSNLSAVLDRLAEFLNRPVLSDQPPTREELAALNTRWVPEAPLRWQDVATSRDGRLFDLVNGAMMARLGYDEPKAAWRRALGLGSVVARCDLAYLWLKEKKSRPLTWRRGLRFAYRGLTAFCAAACRLDDQSKTSRVQ